MDEIVVHRIVEAQGGQASVLPLWRGPFSSERVHTLLRTSPMGDAAPYSSTARNVDEPNAETAILEFDPSDFVGSEVA